MRIESERGRSDWLLLHRPCHPLILPSNGLEVPVEHYELASVPHLYANVADKVACDDTDRLARTQKHSTL